MKYEKAELKVIEFDMNDIVTESGQCMDNANMSKEMGQDYVCDGVRAQDV